MEGAGAARRLGAVHGRLECVELLLGWSPFGVTRVVLEEEDERGVDGRKGTGSVGVV